MQNVLTVDNELPEHLQPLAEARALFDVQEYLPAMAQFEQLARQGSATASSTVAWMHRTGTGVPVSVELAQQWYEYALKLGSRMATHHLASLYRERGEKHEALRMFEESARNGYLPSMYRAGSMSLVGDGVPRDIDKARR